MLEGKREKICIFYTEISHIIWTPAPRSGFSCSLTPFSSHQLQLYPILQTPTQAASACAQNRLHAAFEGQIMYWTDALSPETHGWVLKQAVLSSVSPALCTPGILLLWMNNSVTRSIHLMQCILLLFLVFAFNMHSAACIETKVIGRKGAGLECPTPHFSLYFHLPVLLFLLLFLSLFLLLLLFHFSSSWWYCGLNLRPLF